MDHNTAFRDHVAKLLLWEDAHGGFDSAVDGIPAASRGVVPDGFPHSAWQLVEHLRLAQADILDFCRNSDYEEGTFPDDYWPKSAAPPYDKAWDESLASFRKDRSDMVALVQDPKRKVGGGGTIVYLNADGELDAIVARAERAGMSVLLPRTAIGPEGFIAILRDAEGNQVGFHQEA